MRSQGGSFENDPDDVASKQREIEAEGEPVSIAESIKPHEIGSPDEAQGW